MGIVAQGIVYENGKFRFDLEAVAPRVPRPFENRTNPKIQPWPFTGLLMSWRLWEPAVYLAAGCPIEFVKDQFPRISIDVLTELLERLATGNIRPSCGCGKKLWHRSVCSFNTAYYVPMHHGRPAAVCHTLRVPYLGFLSECVSLHSSAVPVKGHCKVKGCSFPVNGNGEGLCRRHYHFFDYNISLEDNSLDIADLFSDPDSATEPLFFVDWMYRDKDPRINFFHNGTLNRGVTMSETYWNKLIASTADKPDASTNAQMPSGRRIYKGFGKRKIRKSQRKREAGWHGPRPKHDVVRRWSRETIEPESPMWAPPAKETNFVPVENDGQTLEELIEEQERDMAMDALAQQQEEFEGLFTDE